MKTLLLFMLTLLLCSCGAFNQADTPATLVAQNGAYATEIAMLDFSATAEGEASMQDVARLATQAAYTGGVNISLISTLSLLVTPTPQLETSAFELALLEDPQFVGQRLYVNGGTSSSIDGNGCVFDVRENFTVYEQRVYGSWVAYQLKAGTTFRVEWFYTTNQQLMFTDSWVAPRDYENICVWFYISQQDVRFIPGSWQARLFVDDIQMTSPLRFTMSSS